MSFLELVNISAQQGTTLALQNVTLRIGYGEHVAILGSNGSGKSTLIKLMTRELYPLLQPDSSLQLLGKSVWDVTELRSHLGIITNDLVAQLTKPQVMALESVLSGFFSSHAIYPHHHVQSAMLVRAHELLELLQVAHLAQRPMTTLSSGEVRRVVMARALCHQPRILLFDEPSNSLDIAGQLELRRSMEHLAAHGVGILVVTHHLDDIIPAVQRVVGLKYGRIFCDGAKHEILTNHTLSELFGTPLQVVYQNGWYSMTSTQH